jgi:hypothetical protein
MKLFKVIASKAGRVAFDDRIEAESPREAREQMRTLLGLKSLTGVVYAITEIPVELIQSIVDARLTEALARLQTGEAPPSVEDMIRPIAGEEVRNQLASLRDQLATVTAPRGEPAVPARYDAFTAATEIPVEQPVPRRSRNGHARNGTTPTPEPARRGRPSITTNGTLVDWKAVKKLYLRNCSVKQTAAHFELSPNSVKARCRREGWGK